MNLKSTEDKGKGRYDMWYEKWHIIIYKYLNMYKGLQYDKFRTEILNRKFICLKPRGIISHNRKFLLNHKNYQIWLMP
jgi:hypothetical protein